MPRTGHPARHRRGTPPWEALRLHLQPPRRVRVSLHTHALVDYLFYGLYRTDHLGLDVPLDLSAIPLAECCGHFPQFVALRGAASPAELPALVEEYAGEELSRYDIPLEALRSRIVALVPHFAEYEPFWRERVQPLERRLLGTWRDHLKESETLLLLQRLTRLRWPFPRLHLYACYHHPSGSALTPYPYLFTTLFDRQALEPNAAWFVGHEALHVLLDAVAWWEHPDASAAITWLGSRHMAEEAICLVLQNRLSTACGLLPESEMQVLPGSTKHLRVYRWLQEHWDEYLRDTARFPTLVEYFLTGLCEARAWQKGWSKP
jgi:hypothetical protein